jgi:hypothetical protein
MTHRWCAADFDSVTHAPCAADSHSMTHEPCATDFPGDTMQFNLPPKFFPRAALFVFALVAGSSAWAASSDEAPFLAENDAAMSKMMKGMQIAPSGDVDKDFVAMMAAHHQGAIDMAQALLRYGRNEQLRRIAHEIIVTQQQEIPAMWLATGQSPVPSVKSSDKPSITGPTDAQPMSRHSMRMGQER